MSRFAYRSQLGYAIPFGVQPQCKGKSRFHANSAPAYSVTTASAACRVIFIQLHRSILASYVIGRLLLYDCFRIVKDRLRKLLQSAVPQG